VTGNKHNAKNIYFFSFFLWELIFSMWILRDVLLLVHILGKKGLKSDDRMVLRD
jgi:hypothetical protein